MAYYPSGTALDVQPLTAGQTFTRLHADGPSGVWDPTIVESPAGVYTFSEVIPATAAVGRWTWISQPTANGDQITFWFDVEAQVGVDVAAPVITATDLGFTLYQGDTYSPGFAWTLDGAPNLATGTIALVIGRDVTAVLTVAGTATGVHPSTQTVRVPMTIANTTLLGSKSYGYQLRHTSAGGAVTTLAAGPLMAISKIV